MSLFLKGLPKCFIVRVSTHLIQRPPLLISYTLLKQLIKHRLLGIIKEALFHTVNTIHLKNVTTILLFKLATRQGQGVSGLLLEFLGGSPGEQRKPISHGVSTVSHLYYIGLGKIMQKAYNNSKNLYLPPQSCWKTQMCSNENSSVVPQRVGYRCMKRRKGETDCCSG